MFKVTQLSHDGGDIYHPVVLFLFAGLFAGMSPGLVEGLNHFGGELSLDFDFHTLFSTIQTHPSIPAPINLARKKEKAGAAACGF
jgi:hypothetical protein